MTDRASLEKEINDLRRSVAQVDRDVRQLRDWISTNERAVASQPETLRRITEDGLARARSDLGVRDLEMRTLRENLMAAERRMALYTELDRKYRDIQNLERELERVTGLLERHRSEFYQLQQSLEQLTPAPAVPSELVLPNNARFPLDVRRGQYLIGWADAGAQRLPDIDLTSLGGGSMGVSRNHALLRFRGGQWDIEDLDSTNGTALNEAPLAPRTPTQLADKTTIRVGSIKLFFRYITQTVRL